jgi:hypothetical protein
MDDRKTGAECISEFYELAHLELDYSFEIDVLMALSQPWVLTCSAPIEYECE